MQWSGVQAASARAAHAATSLARVHSRSGLDPRWAVGDDRQRGPCQECRSSKARPSDAGLPGTGVLPQPQGTGRMKLITPKQGSHVNDH